jgi:hypothetical protein
LAFVENVTLNKDFSCSCSINSVDTNYPADSIINHIVNDVALIVFNIIGDFVATDFRVVSFVVHSFVSY